MEEIETQPIKEKTEVPLKIAPEEKEVIPPVEEKVEIPEKEIIYCLP